MKTKEDFHLLIDSIDDEKALEAYYELVKMLSGSTEGQMLQELSPAQHADLMRSYEESLDAEELVGGEEVKAEFRKWL